jgi:hypothetical protein
VGVVSNICNPSYAGGVNNRIRIQASQRTQDPIKITKAKGLWYGSRVRVNPVLPKMKQQHPPKKNQTNLQQCHMENVSKWLRRLPRLAAEQGGDTLDTNCHSNATSKHKIQHETLILFVCLQLPGQLC